MVLLHKIWCKLNLHVWVDRPISGIRKNPDGSCDYYYRACRYCGKLQYKKRNGKWKNATVLYETNTQITHKTAERLAKSAADLSNELSKFDNHKKQKTRVFMNLLYITRALSNDYTRLQKDIRQLHISKQLSDIESEKVKTKLNN